MIIAMFDSVNATSTLARAAPISAEDAHVLRGLLLIHYTSNVELAVKITEHLRTASYVVGKSKKDVSCKDFSASIIPPTERIRKWFSVRPDQNTALPIAAAHYIAPPQHGARPASVLPFIKQLASQSRQLFEDTRCLFLTGAFMHSLIEKRLIVPSVIHPNDNSMLDVASHVADLPVLPQRSKELKRKGSTGRSSSLSKPAIIYATVEADIKREEIGLNLARMLPIEIIWLFGILEFLSDAASAANENKANLISMFHALTNHGRPINTVPSKGCNTFLMLELSSLAYSLVATYSDAQRLGTTTKKSSSPVISQITKDTIFHTAPSAGSTKGTAHSLFSQRRFGAVKLAGYDALDQSQPLSLNWSTQSAALMLFFGCNVNDITVDPSSPILQNIPGAHKFLRAHLVELSSMIPNWFILVMLSSLGMLAGKMTIRRSIAKKELSKNSAPPVQSEESSSSSYEEDASSSNSSNGGSTSSDEDFEDEAPMLPPKKPRKRKRISEEEEEEIKNDNTESIVESEESAMLPSGCSGGTNKKKKLLSKSAQQSSVSTETTTDDAPKKRKKSIFDNPKMAARKVSRPPMESRKKPEYILPPNSHWVSTTAVATVTIPRPHVIPSSAYPAVYQQQHIDGGSMEEEEEDAGVHPSEKLLVPISAEDHYNALRQSLLNESCSSSESSEIDLNLDTVLQRRLATRVSGECIEQIRSSMNLSRTTNISQPASSPHDDEQEVVAESVVGVGMMDVDIQHEQYGESQNDLDNNTTTTGMMQLYEATYMDIQQAHSSFTDELLERNFSEPSSPITAISTQQSQSYFPEYSQPLEVPSQATVIRSGSNALQRQSGPPLHVTVGRVVELGFQDGIVEEDASLSSNSKRQQQWQSNHHPHENVDSDSTTGTAQCDAMYDVTTEDEFDQSGLRTISAEIAEAYMAIDPYVAHSTFNVIEQSSHKPPHTDCNPNFASSNIESSCPLSAPLDAKQFVKLVATNPTVAHGSIVQIKAAPSSTPIKKVQFNKKKIAV
jgi:hypothetical protein